MNGSALVVGIFVGGRGTRMGGVDKGLLKAPGSELTLVERLLGQVRSALGEAQVLLVGDARAYTRLGLAGIADQPSGVGPIGGLGGLLRHARGAGTRGALALACDLPFVDAALLRRLAGETPEAAALVAHQNGVRNPLIARYDASRALPALERAIAAGKRSLQAVLDELGSEARLLSLSGAESATLDDWDRPEDVRR